MDRPTWVPTKVVKSCAVFDFDRAHINSSRHMQKIRSKSKLFIGAPDTAMAKSCQIVIWLSILSCAWLFRTIRAKNPLQIVCFVESWVLSSCARRAEDFCSGSNHRRHLSYTQFTSYSSLRFPIEAEGLQTETSASLDTRTTSGHITSVFKSLNLPAKQPALICWPIALPNPTFALPHGLHLRGVHDRG